MNATTTHRGWIIAPVAIGYDIQHPDYDRDNEIDWRHGHADTVEGARVEIDRLLAEDAEWTEAASILKTGVTARSSEPAIAEGERAELQGAVADALNAAYDVVESAADDDPASIDPSDLIALGEALGRVSDALPGPVSVGRAAAILATTPPTTNDAIPAGMAILPPEVAAHILKIGRVEWGQTHAHDAEGHGEHIARSVRLTAEAFAQEGDQHMHGLWLEGTETVVAHTGTSPNAPATTQALVGMWNWFYDQAALSAAPSAPATEAGDIERTVDPTGFEWPTKAEWRRMSEAEIMDVLTRQKRHLVARSATPTDQVKDGKGGVA